jgi:hypothetical protein
LLPLATHLVERRTARPIDVLFFARVLPNLQMEVDKSVIQVLGYYREVDSTIVGRHLVASFLDGLQVVSITDTNTGLKWGAFGACPRHLS